MQANDQKIEYQFYPIEEDYAVWLGEIHRFLILKEPAFFVFESYAAGHNISNIAEQCTIKYHLPETEALRFSQEIINEVEELIATSERNTSLGIYTEAELPGIAPTIIQHCTVNGKRFNLLYGDEQIERIFSPLFSQFEIHPEEIDVKDDITREPGKSVEIGRGDFERNKKNTLAIFKQEQKYFLRVNDGELLSYPEIDFKQFHGEVYAAFLELMHNRPLHDWMGVFHASAVAREQGALIFVAGSGSGKSTTAALMMAHGYRVLSDDFLPVAMDFPEVYPLPTALSVKTNAISHLKKWFPELDPEDLNDEKNVDDEHPGDDYVTFLPISEKSINLSPVPTRAILFVRYDPDVPFSLIRESNVEMMNSFLKQSWIAQNPIAASRFLEWYFSLPVYSLVYSDTEQMVEGLNNLF